MKCNYCGSNLSLDDEVCPYCGKVNEQAKQHRNDMKHYKGKFEDTKKDVYYVTNRYTKIVSRVVVIAVLVVLVIACLIVTGSSYKINRAIQSYKAKQNIETYKKVLDQYIEEENYQAFASFCSEHSISGYDNSYEMYIPVQLAAQSYNIVYRQIMDVVCLDDSRDQGQIVESLSDSLNYFYDSLSIDQYEYYEDFDREENKKALNTMHENVKGLLKTYCNISEEDANELETMSKAKRAVLLEEAIINVE